MTSRRQEIVTSSIRVCPTFSLKSSFILFIAFVSVHVTSFTVLYCPPIDSIEGLHVEPSYSSYDVNSSISVTCTNSNFTQVGASTLTCSPEAIWEPPIPICLACGLPESPTRGAVLIGQNTTSTVAIYTCDTGFTLIGQKQVTCLQNGSWSETPPSCYAECGEPASLGHGFWHVTCMHETCGATYACDVAYFLVGLATSVCTEEGVWTQPEAICQDILCEGPPVLTDGGYSTDLEADIAGQYPPNTNASYTCNRGHALNGAASVTCMIDGSWSDVAPTCTMETMEDQSTTVVNDTTADTATMATNTTTSHTITTAGCPTPAIIPNGSYRRYGKFLVYRCNHGYLLRGSDERVCLDNTSWSGSSPTCELMSSLNTTPMPGFRWEQVFLVHAQWEGRYIYHDLEYSFRFTVKSVQLDSPGTIIGLFEEDSARFDVRGTQDTSGEIVFQLTRLLERDERFRSEEDDWNVRGHLVEHACTWTYVGNIHSPLDGFDILNMYTDRDDTDSTECTSNIPNLVVIIAGVAVSCILVLILGVVAIMCIRRHGGIRASGHRTLTSFENPVYEYENSLNMGMK